MTHVIWIVVIGVLLVPVLTAGSFWISDRSNEFLAFLFILVLSVIIYPLIIIHIMQ